eukprot:scaffold22138_cov59-Phaeocystis_antarctica.AAC.2
MMLGNNIASRNKITCRSNQKIPRKMVTLWLRSWHAVSPSAKDRLNGSVVSRHARDAMMTLKTMTRWRKKPSCHDTGLIKDSEGS